MKEIKVQKENMERVTKMVADEVRTLKAQCDRERENAKMIKIEADRVSLECFSYKTIPNQIRVFTIETFLIKLTAFILK